MIRPRKKGNGEMPPNLYRKLDKRTDKVYFSYKDPRTGKFHGLGSDESGAIRDALALNAAIYTGIRSAKLAQIQTAATAPEGFSLNKLAMKHLGLCEKRGMKPVSIRSRTKYVNRILRHFGPDRALQSIGVAEFAKLFDGHESKGHARYATGLRTAAVEMWKDALHAGWADDNVPGKTRKPIVEVKRERLSLDEFKAIYAAAADMDSWLQPAMALAFVTAQRREDIGAMEFRQVIGSSAWVDGDYLHVVQIKTGAKIRIPLGLEIEGMRLGDAIKACRDRVVSRWLIHHCRNYGGLKAGSPVYLDTISGGFARAREKAGIKAEAGKIPPTFHEIRSLSIRLHTARYGPEFAQALAGHKQAATTDIYRDTRGSEWAQIVI